MTSCQDEDRDSDSKDDQLLGLRIQHPSNPDETWNTKLWKPHIALFNDPNGEKTDLVCTKCELTFLPNVCSIF